MGWHNDKKVARKYKLPVEALREGLPEILHHAPDNTIQEGQEGRFIRVSSLAGLQAALAKVALAPVGKPIRVYIAPYLPLEEADNILSFLGIQKKAVDVAEWVVEEVAEEAAAAEEDATEGEEASCASSFSFLPHPVVIANPSVLHAKRVALELVLLEIENINKMLQEMVEKPDIYAHEVTQYYANPATDELGLTASKWILTLKETYLVAQVSSGHTQGAISVLEQIDQALYKSLFSNSLLLTEDQESKEIRELAKDYSEKHELNDAFLSSSNVARQLLGVISFVDWEDRKRLIIEDKNMIGERTKIMRSLKKQKRRFKRLVAKRTLIGAALPKWNAPLQINLRSEGKED